MNNILDNLKWRYAVKRFDSNKMLEAHKIEKIKEAFRLTATSYGLQPIKLIVVKSKELRKLLVPLSFDQPQVVDASHLLVLCRETKIDADYIEAYFKRIQQIRGTSNEILNPFKQELVASFNTKKEEEIAQWATNQAYLIMGNLLTVCAAEEIDACPMEDFIPQEYDNILGLSKLGLASVLAMPVGYRAIDDMFAGLKKVRKNSEESIIEID